MKQKVSYLAALTNGLLKENPVLRLVLGCCPTLAVTTAVFNGIGMGLGFTGLVLGSMLQRDGIVRAAEATAHWSQSVGKVVLVAEGLPQLPTDRTFAPMFRCTTRHVM